MSKIRVSPSDKIEIAPGPGSANMENNRKTFEDAPMHEESKHELLGRKHKISKPIHSNPDEDEKLNPEKLGVNEQELEALIYAEEGDADEYDSLRDELGEDLGHANSQDIEGIQPQYSGAFQRQFSKLANATIKRNKTENMDTIVRDASNGLSYTRMKKRLDRIHPRKMVNGELVKYPICGTSTGWHLPKRKYRKSDLKDFGVGVCLYFKWLKYLI